MDSKLFNPKLKLKMSYPFSEIHTDCIFTANDGTEVKFIRYVAAQHCQSPLNNRIRETKQYSR